MVTIIALLVAVGIEITKGLGWLTTQDWLDDLMSLLWVFALVIIAAAVFALMFFAIKRSMNKNRQNINWDSYGETDEQQENENSKERS